MLDVQDVSFSYRHKVLLQRISFSCQPGRLVGIVGPNGCGKSTLMKLVAGQLTPQQGRICLQGQAVSTLKRRQLARQLAFLPQQPLSPPGIRVEQLLRMGRYPYQSWYQQWTVQDQQQLQQVIDLLQLEPLLLRDISELSGGQRQRAWLGMILAQDAPVILLDEPTSALDIGHQVEVMEAIRHIAETGKTVLIVLHDLAMAARYCDDLLALSEGVVQQYGPASGVLNAELVRQLYGTEVDILRAPCDNAPVVVPRRQPLAGGF